MEDADPEPYSQLFAGLIILSQNLPIVAGIGILTILFLLFSSALISGSEIAFFSLTHSQIDTLRETPSRNSKAILGLLEKPKHLLATILITNNVVNIGIIILAGFLTPLFFDFSQSPVLGFIIQVIVITFVILLVAEVLPKVYASRYSEKFAHLMAQPLVILEKICRPLSTMMVVSTSLIDRRITKKGHNLSINELSHAIDITTTQNSPEDNTKLLKGIVQFSNLYAREIMKARVDVVAVEYETSFEELKKTILEAGYSRIPVYKETFDNIAGILYIKDLLPYLKESSFNWQGLLRPCFFVPESKKLSDLLKEFQQKKIHLAVVVDEYGGTSGIVTLEDILEEIVGEINDEFDTDEIIYSQLDANTFVFEGKTSLKDFCTITQTNFSFFSQARGDSDSLAGLILELKEEFPGKGEKISYRHFDFTIEAVDHRRIKRIKVSINPTEEE